MDLSDSSSSLHFRSFFNKIPSSSSTFATKQHSSDPSLSLFDTGQKTGDVLRLTRKPSSFTSPFDERQGTEDESRQIPPSLTTHTSKQHSSDASLFDIRQKTGHSPSQILPGSTTASPKPIPPDALSFDARQRTEHASKKFPSSPAKITPKLHSLDASLFDTRQKTGHAPRQMSGYGHQNMLSRTVLYETVDSNSLVESRSETTWAMTIEREFGSQGKASCCCPILRCEPTCPSIVPQPSSFAYTVDETMLLKSISSEELPSNVSCAETKTQVKPSGSMRQSIKSAMEWTFQEVGLCIQEVYTTPWTDDDLVASNDAHQKVVDKVQNTLFGALAVSNDSCQCTGPPNNVKHGALLDSVHADSDSGSLLISKSVSASSTFSEFSEVDWESQTS